MIPIGSHVTIISGPEYNKKFIGMSGVVKNHAIGSDGSGRVGVQFDGERNPASEKGLFWFHVDHVALPTETTDRPSYFCQDVYAAFNSWMHASHRHSGNYLVIPGVKRVIYSGPKTIILWADGTKTIVSCGEGESYDHYTGFCAAVTKKLFGSTSHAKKVLGRVIHID